MQAYSKGDLERFQKKWGLPQQSVATVTGSGASILGHTEANLDVQYIMATGRNVTTNFWLASGFSFDLVQWAADVLSKDTTTKVWSVSYGENIYVVKADYAQRLDAEFSKMAALGVTVVVASGDTGVYSRESGGSGFQPSFPACLPSVTAVGATQLTSAGVEDSATKWSGGGFSPSSYFSMPAWQQSAAQAYLASGVTLPPESMWDRKGRGFPDVSAVGVGFKVASVARGSALMLRRCSLMRWISA